MMKVRPGSKSTALVTGAGVLLFGLLSVWIIGFDRMVGWLTLLCDKDYIRNLIESSGRGGPLIFIGLQLLQVLVAPIPGDIVVFLGGYLFGAWWGIGLSTLGQFLGSLLNFYIGALLGKRLLLRLMGNDLYCKCNGLVQGKGAVAIFLFFLLPGFPKDTLCLFLGMTRMPIGLYLTLSTVGRLPWLVAVNLQGAAVLEHDYVGFLLSAAACILFVMVAYFKRETICNWIPARKEPVCVEAIGPEKPLQADSSARREIS